MTVERVPGWLDVPNVPHKMATLRRGLYASTSGAAGVVLPGDLKVSAAAPVGAAVSVAAGGAVIPSNYPGGAGESYSFANSSPATVSVNPTSTAPRSDIVIARIDDPERGAGDTSNTEAEFARLEVIQGVSSTATTVSVPYPAVALARIDLPAATGTVLPGMITDLRQVAIPLQQDYALTIFPSGSVGKGQNFPALNAGYNLVPAETASVRVPTWATKAIVKITVNGMEFQLQRGNLVAGVKTFLGTLPFSEKKTCPENGIITQLGSGQNQSYRQTVVTLGTHDVVNLRGQLVNVGLAGRMTTQGRVAVDYQSQVMIEIRFTGEAV